MKIRLYNAKIMTMEAGRSIFPGEIHIQDDKILSIIDTEGEIPPLTDRFDKEIDCKGNLLMPGFKDAHTHSPMTFLRSYADDMELDTWLNTRVFPMEARLDEESIYEFGRLAILEYLTSGITSIFDMYIMPDVMAKVCMDTGMRCCLVSGLNRFTSSIEKLTDEYVRWNKADPLIKYHLGFHAEYTTPEPLLKELSEVANHYRAPVYTHMSETAHEVAGCK